MCFFTKYLERTLFPCQKKLDKIVEDHSNACGELCNTISAGRDVVMEKLSAQRLRADFQKVDQHAHAHHG